MHIILYFIYRKVVKVHFKSHFIYPMGKPIAPHLLRYQVFGVGDYTLTLGRLEAGALSTFAQLGLHLFELAVINIPLRFEHFQKRAV